MTLNTILIGEFQAPRGIDQARRSRPAAVSNGRAPARQSGRVRPLRHEKRTNGRAPMNHPRGSFALRPRPSRRRLPAALTICAALWAAIVPAAAQTAAGYPQKPVRIFVPYGPGGVGDLTMRILADKLSQQIKQ